MFPTLCRQRTPFPVAYSMSTDGVDEYLHVDSWSQASTDLNKHTISFWYKRAAAGTTWLFYSTNSQNEYAAYIAFDASDRICYRVAGYGTREFITTAGYPDTTSWHHVLCRMDTSRAAGDRLQVWYDGVQQAGSIDDAISVTYLRFFTNNGTNTRHWIAGQWTGGSLNGKLAEVIGVDGSWQDVGLFRDRHGRPADYKTKTGVFGANGFYFNAATTNLGLDASGNGNNYSMSVDNPGQSTDTPTS